MALDLKDLERRLDAALEKETRASLNEWLEKLRKKDKDSSKVINNSQHHIRSVKFNH